MDAFDAAAADEWDAAAQALNDLTAAWETIGAGEVPLPIEPIVTDALAALGGAIVGDGTFFAGRTFLDVTKLSDYRIVYADGSTEAIVARRASCPLTCV